MIKNMKLEEESDDNEERMVNDFYDQHNQNMKSKVRFSSNEKSIVINFFSACKSTYKAGQGNVQLWFTCGPSSTLMWHV